MSFKEKIEDYLIQTYQLEINSNIRFHPVRIVESMKSLIGIEPQNPNSLILNYFPVYLNDFKVKSKTDSEIEQVEYFASMINLELLLKENKFEESRAEIKRLLQVSTGEPILELLLLIYLKEVVILPNLLSIYRSVKFCNGREVKEAILLMVELIMEYQNLSPSLDKIHFLDYSTSLIEISQNSFIRDLEIKSVLQEIDYDNIYSKIRFNGETELGIELINSGRNQILEVINKYPELIENNKNIILLDSIRTILRFRTTGEYDNQLHFAVNELEGISG